MIGIRPAQTVVLLVSVWAVGALAAETSRYAVPWAGGTIAPGNTVVIEDGGSVTANVVADGVLRFERSSGLTVSSTISGTGRMAVAGTGTVALTGLASGTGTFDLAVSVSGGQLLIGSTGTNPLALGRSGVGAVEVSGGSLRSGAAFLGAAPGGIGMATISGGTWSTNTRLLHVGYSGTGTMNITGGRVVNSNGVIGSMNDGVGSVAISDGTWRSNGSLFVGGYQGSTGKGELIVTGGEVSNNTGSIGISVGANGSAIVSGGQWNTAGSLTVANLGSGSLTVAGGLVTCASGVIGTGTSGVGLATITGGTWSTAGGLVVGGSGVGVLTVSGSGAAGGTVIVGGTLSRGAAGTIAIESGGTLRIGSGTTTGVLATDLVNNGAIVFAPSGTSVLAHAVSGTGSLTVAGPGRLVVAGTSGLAGAATVAGGSLLVNGALGSTAVWVEAGGLLGGTGVISGAVTINRNATLAPGASIETLLVGDATWLDGSAFAVEVDSSVPLSVAADLLRVSGDVTISGTVSLDLLDLAASPALFPVGTTLSLMSYSGTWNGGLFRIGGAAVADNASLMLGSQLWTIDYDATTGGTNFSSEYFPGGRFVNLTAVPEPATLGLLLAGLCCAVGPLLRNGLPVARSRRRLRLLT